MESFLFQEFNAVSASQWKQKIQFDLKGADYNETLLTKTLEGITIKPFYHVDDFEKLNIPQLKSDYFICQTIYVSDEQKASELALDALKRGAQSINFIVPKAFNSNLLLNGILEQFPASELHFQFEFLDETFITALINFLKNQKTYFNIDLIGNLAATGNWFFNLKKDHEILENIVKASHEKNYLLGVNASLYQNAGANTVQQIAYALAHANEYLNHFGVKAATTIQFQFAVGSNYFMEIAKFRAFRYLWHLLLKEYQTEAAVHIFAEPTLRNKTLYDYNTNLLRTTTACMSAILGGVTTISNVSYDRIYKHRNEFGERIARNQLLILKEESNFINAEKIAENSYYIETLTKQLADKALILFKEIEQSGGFLAQLKDGIIQRKIEESAQKEQELFDANQLTLLGTNKYPNPQDLMHTAIEIYPFLRKKSRKTLIPTIIPQRLAERYEQNRLSHEEA